MVHVNCVGYLVTVEYDQIGKIDRRIYHTWTEWLAVREDERVEKLKRTRSAIVAKLLKRFLP